MELNGGASLALVEPRKQDGLARLRRRLDAGKHLPILAIDNRKATGKGDAVSFKLPLEFGLVLVGKSGRRNGNRLNARVVGDVLRQFEHHARGVLTQFGSGLRE